MASSEVEREGGGILSSVPSNRESGRVTSSFFDCTGNVDCKYSVVSSCSTISWE